jgi:hypothetical protein
MRRMRTRFSSTIQSPLDRFSVKQWQQATEKAERRFTIWLVRAEHDDARILVGWIGPQVGKIHVEGDQDAAFEPSAICQYTVGNASEAFIIDRVHIIDAATQEQVDGVNRHVLVELDPHSALGFAYAGSAMTRS